MAVKQNTLEIQRRPRTRTGKGMRHDAGAAADLDRQTLQTPQAAEERGTFNGQRRPPGGTDSTRGVAMGQGGPTPHQPPGTNASVSRTICYDLKNIFAPDEFDGESSVLACGFPRSTTAAQCRNFMSWVGPVLHVANAPSIGNETNFVVVFASDDWAQAATRQPLPYDLKGTAIVCRIVDSPPGLWETWGPGRWFGGTASVTTPVTPVTFPTAPLGVSQLGPAASGVADSIATQWNSLLKTDGVRNVGDSLATFGTQLRNRVGQGYT